MGSALVNYYRKKDEKDDHMPKVLCLLLLFQLTLT